MRIVARVLSVLPLFFAASAKAHFFAPASDNAVTPGYGWIGDAATGMFRPVVGVVAIGTSGVERVRVNSVGVGIGTTAPVRLLNVGGVIRLNPVVNPTSPSAGDIFIDSAASNTLKYHNGTSWVIVGGGSSSFPLLANPVGSAGSPAFSFVGGDSDNGMFSPTGDTLGFSTAGLERLRISSAGSVGIGTTNPASKLDVQGEVKFGNTSSACNPTNEGQQRYNSTSKRMEFCNGTIWDEIGQPAGALCGKANFNTSNGWSGSINCKGFDPSTSCPTGYSRTAIVQNGGVDTAYFCVKN